jgi:hypothetical protein
LDEGQPRTGRSQDRIFGLDSGCPVPRNRGDGFSPKWGERATGDEEGEMRRACSRTARGRGWEEEGRARKRGCEEEGRRTEELEDGGTQRCNHAASRASSWASASTPPRRHGASSGEGGTGRARGKEAWGELAGWRRGGGDEVRRALMRDSSLGGWDQRDKERKKKRRKNKKNPTIRSHLSVANFTFVVFGPNRKWVRPIPP